MQMDYSGHIFVPSSVQLVAVASPIASDMPRREAMRQDMQQKATHELVGIERHDLMALGAARAIVLVAGKSRRPRRRRSGGHSRSRLGAYPGLGGSAIRPTVSSTDASATTVP
jgi:hypothetical protein